MKRGDKMRHKLSGQTCVVRRVLAEVDVDGVQGQAARQTYEAENLEPVPEVDSVDALVKAMGPAPKSEPPEAMAAEIVESWPPPPPEDRFYFRPNVKPDDENGIDKLAKEIADWAMRCKADFEARKKKP